MQNRNICNCCGARLDYGERCDCRYEKESQSGYASNKYYRTFPQLTDEQKLEALHNLIAAIK